ncbi:hypothetical protein G7Y89_g1657 [Cudoniella acicularis]|uniref:Methyltransferase domain-containing protein n=1 Tax=Cudoniella acicularis TaxID=354080 RepID=A0A8H4W768_9HELO|nr:hypothetical protein G7Y89_g1657 [Cudoniella acicularis]
MPSYLVILTRLQDTHDLITLLDVGCCFGQNLRKLVVDGAPGKQLIGVELKPEFISLGFELFKDREKYEGQLFAGDIFDEDVKSPLNALKRQVRAAVRLISLLRDKPGTMVLGRHVGSENPGEYPHRTNESGVTFSHNEETFKKMWIEVGEKTGTHWSVQPSLQDPTSLTADSKRAHEQWKGGNKIMWLVFEAARNQLL